MREGRQRIYSSSDKNLRSLPRLTFLSSSWEASSVIEARIRWMKKHRVLYLFQVGRVNMWLSLRNLMLLNMYSWYWRNGDINFEVWRLPKHDEAPIMAVYRNISSVKSCLEGSLQAFGTYCVKTKSRLHITTAKDLLSNVFEWHIVFVWSEALWANVRDGNDAFPQCWGASTTEGAAYY